MNITYNTRINLIDYTTDPDLGNVAQRLRYSITGIAETGETVVTYGECALSPARTDDFTPWDQLTEEQGLAWLEASVGWEELEARKQTIATQLQNQLFPLAPVAPPWAG
jgi:hypothetical protein